MERRDIVMSMTQCLEKEVFNRINHFKQVHMFKDELKILNFLKSGETDLADSYMLSLVKGREGILRRLAGSLLREDIMGLTSNSIELYVIGSNYALNVQSIDEYWQKMLAVLNTYALKSGKIYKLYPLSVKESLVIPVKRTYAFNRVEIDGEILLISEVGVKVIEHAAELLELMRCKDNNYNETEQSSWMKLAEELINGSANLSLSYAYWNKKKKEIKQKADDQEITNIIDWVLLQKRHNAEFDSSLFFEQLSVEGHNLHPGTKTKKGMEPEDVFRYAPEFDGVTDIQFVGIRKDYAEWRVLEENEHDANAFLFKEYRDLPKVAEQELTQYGLHIKDYVFVPVHSWQLEKTIPEIYKQELERKIVVPIKGIVVPSGATSSFRTVVPLMKGKTPKHAIKVAVNSQMTSTVRSISANTTNNAAVFTRLIRSVMKQEQTLLKTFVPICECAGYNFKSKKIKESKENNYKLKSRNLSAVLRENVETFIALDEVAIVGSSLFAESPISEKSILIELVEMYAEVKNETSMPKAAVQFVSEYLSIALPGFLTLMVKYGIGLEGHLQNSVMVFKEGRPVRMLFRDWGGARIYRSRIQQQQMDVQFYPGSVTMTDNLEEMHNKVFYTVFQNQCGELILQVCKHFELEEGVLWQEVHRICDKVFGELAIQPPYSENARIDKEALYKEKVDHKALTKMRLAPEGEEYSYTVVPNPLHEFGIKEG